MEANRTRPAPNGSAGPQEVCPLSLRGQKGIRFRTACLSRQAVLLFGGKPIHMTGARGSMTHSRNPVPCSGPHGKGSQARGDVLGGLLRRLAAHSRARGARTPRLPGARHGPLRAGGLAAAPSVSTGRASRLGAVYDSASNGIPTVRNSHRKSYTVGMSSNVESHTAQSPPLVALADLPQPWPKHFKHRVLSAQE